MIFTGQSGSTGPARVIIKVTYQCNNRCVFCHSSTLKSQPPLDLEEARRRIHRAREIGAKSVLFSGGEPTIHRQLPEMAEYCNKLGLGVGLITNARMLAYKPFAKRMADAGLEYVYCSLHGPETVHDQVVASPGAYRQTLKALQFVNALGTVAVTANAVVVRETLPHLRHLLEVLAPLQNVRVKFSAVEPKGSALEDRTVVPELTDSAQAVHAVLEQARKIGFPRDRVAVDGFPHCLSPWFAQLQADMYSDGIFAIQEVNETQFHAIDYGNMKKPGACLGCRIGDECRATYRQVWDQLSTEILHPEIGGVSNSFNYFPADSDSTHGNDPKRLIRVSGDDGEVKWFETDTSDFSPHELLTIRDVYQQVYLEVGGSVLADDFASQFRKLVLKHTATVPTFQALDEDLFSQADQAVADLLRTARGDVLDVGCGHTRYASVLRRLLTERAVTYLGVDPAPGDSVLELAEHDGAQVLQQGIEATRVAPGQFDWIWVLRSHNHLADLWTAYSTILRGLKWGGRLLVVDNVAFGLVRSEEMKQAVQKLGTAAPPEHLRNHDSRQAHEFLRRFPLRLLREEPVAADTANQWLLLFEKAWPSGEFGRDTF